MGKALPARGLSCLVPIILFWFATLLPGWSQSEESELPPLPGEYEPAVPTAPEGPYWVPDVPHAIQEKTEVRNRWFTLKPGLVLIADYTAFDQDAESVAQVGPQRDQWDDRAARAMLRGTLGLNYKVSYLIAAEYKGFESDPEDTWQLTDLSFAFPVAGPATKLTVGKTKETFSYEMVGDAANLPHQERVLSPFFVSRNVGLRLNHVVGSAQRMTASAGVYNDGWVSGDDFSDSGTDFSTRVTGLMWDQDEGRCFLHLGIAGRYAGMDENAARYRGRPESNVADYYVDTGTFDADHAWHLGFEGLWNWGPVSVLAEYNQAWVRSVAGGDPSFSGCYVTASWILTGETRPYDRTVGYARRVMPKGRWGAPELVARFSYVELDDDRIRGGAFDKIYLGINWWATRRWKLGVGGGRTWLDRGDQEGITDSLMCRFQWVY